MVIAGQLICAEAETAPNNKAKTEINLRPEYGNVKKDEGYEKEDQKFIELELSQVKPWSSSTVNVLPILVVSKLSLYFITVTPRASETVAPPLPKNKIAFLLSSLLELSFIKFKLHQIVRLKL